MEPTQQQQQPPPTSPVRGVATAAATGTSSMAPGPGSAAAAVAVTRSISMESHETSRSGGTIGTAGGHSHAAGTVGSGTASHGAAGGGSIGGGNANDGGSVAGGSHSGSFKTSSPMAAPRQAGATGAVPVPPFPTGAVVADPPPWPTTTTSTTTGTTSTASSSSPQPPMAPAPASTPPRGTPPPAENNQPGQVGVVYPTQQQNQNIAPPTMPCPSPPMTSINPPSTLPAQSLSLSMTNSGEFMAATTAVQQQQQGASNTTNPSNATADSSVLLGLEELERQQADVEKRRAEKQAEEQRKLQQQQQSQQSQQQQQQGGMGLPPLPPSGYPPRPTSTSPAQQYLIYPGGDQVPAQIHLLDDSDEDNTILSSDALENRAAGGGAAGGNVNNKELKRVMSIEKIGKSMQVSLRRFRSWSQDTLARSSADNPAANSSVDSTHQDTLTSAEGGVEGGQGRQVLGTIGGTSTTPTNNQQRSSSQKSNQKLAAGASSSNNTAKQSDIGEPYLDEDEPKPLIYGYLHKLGRNGHWQKRFFETNGERLTYYKSVKRTKALATLDLCKVGEIAIDKTDPDQSTFTIQVKNRPYYLRAEDKARCNDWVIILNRAREARMNVGNIRLLTQGQQKEGEAGMPLGLLDAHRSQAGSDDFAPCIVISAMRPRTRAVSDFQREEVGVNGMQPPDLLTSNTALEEEQIEVTRWDDNQQLTQGVVGVVGGSVPLAPSPMGDRESHAKWEKRHSKMHNLSLRFLSWARSITHQADACRRESDVIVVPKHVVMASQQQMSNMPAQGGGGVASPTSGIGASAAGSTNTASVAVGGEEQKTQGQRHRKNSSGLPDLMEEKTPTTPGAAENQDNSEHNRSRASTESPAFGSAYV